jgi:hypothetical protein
MSGIDRETSTVTFSGTCPHIPLNCTRRCLTGQALHSSAAYQKHAATPHKAWMHAHAPAHTHAWARTCASRAVHAPTFYRKANRHWGERAALWGQPTHLLVATHVLDAESRRLGVRRVLRSIMRRIPRNASRLWAPRSAPPSRAGASKREHAATLVASAQPQDVRVCARVGKLCHLYVREQF